MIVGPVNVVAALKEIADGVAQGKYKMRSEISYVLMQLAKRVEEDQQRALGAAKTRNSDPSTSSRAAAAINENGVVAKMCRAVHDCLKTFGPGGATGDQVAARMGQPYGKIGSRFIQLERAGLAVRTDEERKSLTSNRMREVWVAKEFVAQRNGMLFEGI